MLSNIWTHRKGTSTARASDGRRRAEETRERSVSLARHSSDISRGGARVKRNQRECGKGGRAGGAEYSGLRFRGGLTNAKPSAVKTHGRRQGGGRKRPHRPNGCPVLILYVGVRGQWDAKE